jgi:hypothetical protein
MEKFTSKKSEGGGLLIETANAETLTVASYLLAKPKTKRATALTA